MGVERKYCRGLTKARNALCAWSVSEGEHLDKSWLKEIPWKGIPQRVIVPYLKTLLCSLIFFLSTSGNENPVGSRQNYIAKAKYSTSPIVNQYREGKVKSRGVTPVK